MAIYNGGILDEYKNKIGNVVGRRWRNLDVISKYQPNVSNPNTSAQQVQRMKFGELSKLAKAMRIPLAIGMAGVAAGTKNPVRGQFITRNMDVVDVTLPDAIDIDFTMMKVAAGGFVGAEFGTPDVSTALTVKVAFTRDSITDVTSEDDMVHIVVYAPAKKLALDQSGRVGLGSVTVTVPASWNGEEVHVWGYVVAKGVGNRPTGPSEVSPSEYLGIYTIS